MDDDGHDGGRGSAESLQQLERGLAIIQAFSHDTPMLSIADAARLTGTSRAAARRVLLTLEKLGHVRSEGRMFSLTPRVLNLGWAYLSSLNLWEVARPAMEDLVEVTGESCSASTLDIPDIVYVARVSTHHLMTNALVVGARLPASATAHGRVLLAELEPSRVEEFLDTYPLIAHTPHTITDRQQLSDRIAEVREQGWASSDQEYEIGLRSVATAVRDPSGEAVAALGISCLTARVSDAQLHEEFLPQLLATAADISQSLTFASFTVR